MTTTICVTQKDIDHGQRRQCTKCPVALAISRRLAEGYFASVSSDVVIGFKSGAFDIKTRRSVCELSTPPRIAEWINDFDKGRSVYPTRFVLDIPAGVLKP